MSDDFKPKSQDENSVKLQHQDSFHMKKLKFHFEIHCQIFAPNMVQTIIWLKINNVWQFYGKISPWKFCQISTSHEKIKISFWNLSSDFIKRLTFSCVERWLLPEK